MIDDRDIVFQVLLGEIHIQRVAFIFSELNNAMYHFCCTVSDFPKTSLLLGPVNLYRTTIHVTHLQTIHFF